MLDSVILCKLIRTPLKKIQSCLWLCKLKTTASGPPGFGWTVEVSCISLRWLAGFLNLDCPLEGRWQPYLLSVMQQSRRDMGHSAQGNVVAGGVGRGQGAEHKV